MRVDVGPAMLAEDGAPECRVICRWSRSDRIDALKSPDQGSSDPQPFVLDRWRGCLAHVDLDQALNWLGGSARPLLQEAIEPEVAVLVVLVPERSHARDVSPAARPRGGCHSVAVASGTQAPPRSHR